MEHLKQETESLWLLAAPPLIWAVHFLASYLTVAVYCAKWTVGPESLGPVRTAIVVYTVAALTGIIGVGYVGLIRRLAGSKGDVLPHDDDTPEDRRRFMGFATLLLSALSLVATIYVALTIVFIGDCR